MPGYVITLPLDYTFHRVLAIHACYPVVRITGLRTVARFNRSCYVLRLVTRVRSRTFRTHWLVTFGSQRHIWLRLPLPLGYVVGCCCGLRLRFTVAVTTVAAHIATFGYTFTVHTLPTFVTLHILRLVPGWFTHTTRWFGFLPHIRYLTQVTVYLPLVDLPFTLVWITFTGYPLLIWFPTHCYIYVLPLVSWV